MRQMLPCSRSTPGAILLSITYGIDIKSTNDEYLKASIEAAHALVMALVPGKFLADIIPIRGYLRAQAVTDKHLTKRLIVRYIPDWFPGANFKVLGKKARDKFKVAVNGPFEYVKNAMKVCPHNNSRLSYVYDPSTAAVRKGNFPVYHV